MKEPWLESERETAPIDWFEGPLGARVLREEAALAPLALDDVFGFELLQVGAWGPARHLLDGARTQHTTLLAPEMSTGVTLCAPLDSLPFRSDSIDAIFLPHTLELVEDPYAVLREAERVLTGEGCLMICGFNPFSGWGARRVFARYFGRPAFPPGTQRMLSERRLRDWVALLGFDVDSVYGYLGLLPLKGRAPKLTDAGSRNPEVRPRAAMTAGAYLLKARKRVPTLTPIRPRRRARQRVLVGAAEPTSKVGQ
jgi:SAM-dependent methyltransferase